MISDKLPVFIINLFLFFAIGGNLFIGIPALTGVMRQPSATDVHVLEETAQICQWVSVSKEGWRKKSLSLEPRPYKSQRELVEEPMHFQECAMPDRKGGDSSHLDAIKACPKRLTDPVQQEQPCAPNGLCPGRRPGLRPFYSSRCR